MARMKDVADRAGVSVATVSNVLTGKRAVTPEVRENVLRAIKELDYHVNMIARGLKTQRTNTIGVVLPDVTKLFFNDVLHGMMTAASDFGYCITLLSSSYNFDTERQSIAALRGNHVDAVILDSCVNCRDAEQWGAELADSLAQSVPIVSLETTLHKERISSIRVDCKRWSGQMTQHLIDQNRRRILYISGPSQLMHEIERLEGYIMTLKRNALPVCDELIAKGDFLSHSGYSIVKQAIANGLEFDAVQASNDQAAIGAIKALKESNIQIPEKVAVTGFDNLFPSTLISPSLTTLSVPRYYMGYEAVSECVRRIETPSAAVRHAVLESPIIIRSSSVPISDTVWDLTNW